MTDAKDVLTSYRLLSDTHKEEFWRDLYALGLTSTSPLPPPPGDVHRPLEGLLIGASVLGSAADREGATGWRGVLGAPASVAAIESTATSMAKTWATLTAVGAPLAWIAAWNAAIADYWTEASSGERIAVIASFAATLAAVVVAIAIMVSADLKARSVASAGQYQARASIAEAYLRSGNSLQPDVQARLWAIRAGIRAATTSHKDLKMILPGAEFLVKDAQIAGGVLRVRENATDPWMAVPDDATFQFA